MKFSYSTLLISLLVSAAAFAQPDKYTYKRKLNKVEKEGYCSVPMSPEVLAHCKSNLNDIRLYNFKDNDTAEVPYIMEWLGTKNEQTAIPFELINDTYNEKCCSYVTLKFTKKQTINQIVLNISDDNFDKSVKLEGSNDNKNWFTIKEHLRIVRFNNADDHFEYTTLDFQNTEFTYFRLKFDDDASKRVTVSNAYAYENKATPGNYCELKMNKWTQSENKKEKISEIIIDLPYMYMVNYITVKSNSKNDFYRNINVYGSNGVFHTPKGDKENWYLLNTSVLTSIENNPIGLNNEATQKLKIEIVNYDNEPVQISEIKAFGEQCRLVANLPASDNMYLTYGRSGDNGATYDLEHFKTKIPKDLTAINYGDEEMKMAATVEKPNPLIQNKKWLWIAMGVVILLIGYFALSMLKKEQE